MPRRDNPAARSRSATPHRSPLTTRSLPPSRSSAGVWEGWWRLVEVVEVVEASRLFDPVVDEDVGLTLNLPVPVRRPNELMLIPRDNSACAKLYGFSDML